MRWILLLSFGLCAFGQTTLTRIPPDEASKHRIQTAQPIYPQIAAKTGIQGNVILQIRIDEFGTAFVSRVVSGHPFLVQAAIDAVNNWKYRPFEVNGKPTNVMTVTMVTFGNPVNHAAEDRSEMLLQHNFWVAIESAQAASAKGDFALAEENVNKASALVPPDGPGLWHLAERLQSMTTSGNLCMAQKKYEEAEQHFKKSFALSEKADKEGPQLAAALGNLGALFAEQKRFDSARDYFVRSLAIYQKNFKRAVSGNAGAQQVYGRAIVFESLMLMQFASQRNDHSDLEKQCRTLSEFQSFFTTLEHESFAAACQPNATPEAAKR